MKNNIKIALLTDCYGGKFIGGGQIHIQNLTKNLENNHNCQIKIFSQKSSNILLRFLWSTWVIPQVIISNFQNHFNLLHSHGYIPGLSAKIISLILKIPVIHTVHGSNLMDLNQKGLKEKLEKFLLTKINYDAQIVVNQNFLKYENNTKTQILIPNGINLPKLSSKPLTINHQPSRILCIGRLEKIKGTHILIKALSQIKTQNWSLNIIGDGSQKNELISLVQKLNLCQKITFQGRRKQISKYYRNADLLVLPSLSEGQPITLLEAWSNKLPVIVTRVGSNPFTVEEKKDGLLVKPNSIGELAKAINFFLCNYVEAKIMGDNGFNKVKKNYTWDKISQKTFFVYQSVLKNRKSS